MKKVTIYTDGACQPNPGIGGWGAILCYGDIEKEIFGGVPFATNNQMELLAAVEALTELKEPCEVQLVTDSKYLKDGNEKWLQRWITNGWRTVEGKPVKNRDYWQRLHALGQKHRISWKWVAAHSGHAYNERVDALAVRGRLTLKG